MGKDLEQTMKFKADISDLKKGIDQANAAIKLAASEYKAAGDGTKAWASSIDGLTSKQKQLATTVEAQRAKLAQYAEKLVLVKDKYGENSAEAIKLQTTMNNLQGSINRTESELRDTEDALGDLEEAESSTGNEANIFGKVFASLKGIIDKFSDSADDAADDIKTLGKESDTAGDKLYDLGDAAKDADIRFQKGLRSGVDVVVKGLIALTTAALVAGSAVVGIALHKGFERLESIDTAKAKLIALKLTTKEVESVMQSANDAVTGTAFSLADAATAAGMAKAAGVELGAALTQHLNRIAGSAAIAGKGMDEMSSVINKVQTSGKATNEELKQLSDMGLPVYQWLAEAAGKTADEMVKLASKGQISSKMLYDALDKNVGDAAKKMGELSLAAAKDNFFAALARSGAAFLSTSGEYGSFFDMFKSGVGSMTGVIGSLKAPMEDAGRAMSSVFGPIVQQGFASLQDAIANIDFTKVALKITSAASTISKVFAAVWDVAKQLFTLLSNLIGDLVRDFSSLVPILKGGVLGGLNALSQAIQALNKHMGIVVPLVKALIVAWATYKTLQLASKAIGSLTKAGELMNAVYVVTIGLKKLEAAATTTAMKAQVAETATKAASTLAQWGLNAAILACPLTWLVVAIAAVVAGLIIFSQHANKLSDEQRKLADSSSAVAEANRDFVASCEDAQKVFDDNAKAIEANAVVAENLADRLGDVMDGTIDVKDKKTEMTKIVETLNKTVDDLNITYDAENDRIIDVNSGMEVSIGRIKDLIKEKLKLAKIESWGHEYNRLLQEQARLETESIANLEERKKWNARLLELNKKGQKLKGEELEAYQKLQTAEKELSDQKLINGLKVQTAEKEYTKLLGGTEEQIKKINKTLQEMEKETSVSGESFSAFAIRIGKSSEEIATAVNATSGNFKDFSANIDKYMKEGNLSFEEAVVQYQKDLALLGENVKTESGQIVADMGTTGSASGEAFIESWKVNEDGVISAVRTTADGAVESWRVIGEDGLVTITRTALDGTISTVHGYIDPVTGAFRKIGTIVLSDADKLALGIPLSAKKSMDNTKKEIEKGKAPLCVESEKTANAALDRFSMLENGGKVTGSNLIRGITNGLQNSASGLFRAANNLASSLLATFRSAFDEHSPAGETEKSGVNLILGLMKGMDRMKQRLHGSVCDIADGVLDNFNLALPDNIKTRLDAQLSDINVTGETDGALITALGKLTEKLGGGIRSGDTNSITINGLKIEEDSEVGRVLSLLSDLLKRQQRMGGVI